MPNQTLRQKLDRNEPALGTFVKINSPAVVEMLGLCGFDFIVVDGEHGSFTHADVEHMVRAAEVVGVSAVVRVAEAREPPILHALDAGAAGVQLPSLRSAQETEAGVRHARFHPAGQRGFARVCRAGGYGRTPLAAFFEEAAEALVVVHVENREMVDDIDALCSVEGVDVVFIGAGDLSQSLGFPGQTGHPAVREAFDHVARRARAAGRHVGAVASSSAEVRALTEAGIHYVVWQSDVAMFAGAAHSAVSAFRAQA